MDALIESIRAAVAADASTEVRAAGVTACRTILTALEAVPGQPLAAAVVAPPMVPPIAAIATALRGMPADQLLDLAIQKLRASLPPGAEPPRVQPLKFQLVPVPGGKP